VIEQSEKAIKNWLSSNVKVGTIVAIRRRQNGLVLYERGMVLSVRPKNFNVGFQQRDGTYSESGTTFDYAGRHWQDREGGTQIVIPTDAVLGACDVCDFGAAFLP
jgi:diphthamide synthase subunit DPH2